jgi:hypothetical protein
VALIPTLFKKKAHWLSIVLLRLNMVQWSLFFTTYTQQHEQQPYPVHKQHSVHSNNLLQHSQACQVDGQATRVEEVEGEQPQEEEPWQSSKHVHGTSIVQLV